MLKLTRWSLLVLLLGAGAVQAQDAGGPPPIMVPPAEPGFGDLSVTPSAGYNQSSSTVPGEAAVADPYSVLEGLINRILELQNEALSGVTRSTVAAYPAERLTAFKDVSTLNGSIEGMLASSTWADNLARVRVLENPQTTKNFRYLKIYGVDGHLDVIARQQAKIREFLQKQPPIGTPPAPSKILADGATPTTTGTGSATTGTGTTGTGAVAPLPPGTPPAVPGEDPVAALQRQIDAVSLKIADPNISKEQRQAYEVERNALSQRLAEIARSSPGSIDPSTAPATPDGHAPAPGAASTTATGTTATGTTAASTGSGTGPGNTTGGTGPAAPAATVALVPNSYGVSPMVLSDAEIRGIMEGLIAKELPIENAKLSKGGMAINKYRQLIGNNGKTKIKSVGKPDYDHYREWIKASPTMKASLDAKAAEIYASRAAVAAPAPAPAATTAPAPSTAPAPTGGTISTDKPADALLPPGSTLPNGKLDLPSTSAR